MPDLPTQWPVRDRPTHPPPGEIHLWHARLSALPCRRDWLDASEQARLATTTATGFCAARTLLRHLLAGALDCAPAEVPITLADNGKPGVRETPLRFNLSHAGDHLLIAIARDRELGIDIEAPRPLRRAEDIARRLFPPEALREWQASGQDPAVFFRLWTALEARQKCLGSGLFGARPDNTPIEQRAFAVAGLPACLAWSPAAPAPRLRAWHWDGAL